ncbi:restriction endonuclease [Actinomyces bowdenii]|uniref:Restriction endonuclease n=1 Tax=Actinomyces bowdenii TaxID=131109 RepID=A0A3P1V246_9ACTO|nr:restriction endonuclease [Actinomyces bowdenii]RRD28262.1 restriction endonuclease [Actinomyces bowdenii]
MVIDERPAPDDARAVRAQPEPAAPLTWEQLMTPLLRLLDDGRVQQFRILQRIALGESPQDLQEQEEPGSWRRPSDSRAALALSHLVGIGAVERPSRGQFRITDLGRQILSEFRGGLTHKDVVALTEYAAAQRRSSAGRHAHEAAPGSRTGAIVAQAVSPTDQIADGVERLRQRLTAELLGRLHNQGLEAYGRTILAVLEAMGYEMGEAPEVHPTADGGIETDAQDDPRGLGSAYIQAKRLSPAGLPAGRPVIQAFTREVLRRGLAHGVFITTGELTADTWAYAERCPVRVVLIDGEGLASLMMRHGVGVRAARTLRILDIDESFFA